MSLLDRIAHSNGRPERTIAALRLLNKDLERRLNDHTTLAAADLSATISTLEKKPLPAETPSSNRIVITSR